MAAFSVFALANFDYDDTDYTKPMKTVPKRRVGYFRVSSKNRTDCMIKFQLSTHAHEADDLLESY